MLHTYAEKQAAYRRRLAITTPVAAVLVFLIFVTSDVVPYSELEERFGWEGETRILPNITILPDDDPFEDIRRDSRLAAMASMDVDLIEERAESEGGENTPVKPKDPEPLAQPEFDDADIRHYPAHTDVSYSENYVILHMVQPEYPPFELLQGIEGDVTVELLVNEEGMVENAWILAVLGPKSFEEASLAAVRQFRFRPPTQNGKPVPMWIRFQVRFRLLG
ncbi:MAG: energy transducer TonB [Candidatus Krumholzibacteriia bacterium]